MNNLSIEELKSLREAYYGMQYEKIVAVLDELIAIRELKGDQVPVAWTSQRSLETKNKIVAFTDDMSALDYGTANGWTDIVELFTAPKKPVVPVGFLFVVKATGAVIYSIADAAIEGTHLIGQIYGDAAIEAAGGWVCTSDKRLMQDMSGIVKDGE